MREDTTMREEVTKWTSGVTLLAALWLVFSPLWTTYSSTANVWVQVIVGIVVGLLALAKMGNPSANWPSGLNLIAGIWFVISPFALAGSSTAVKWNQVVLGVIVGALAIIELSTTATAAEDRSLSAHDQAMAFGERIPPRGSDQDPRNDL